MPLIDSTQYILIPKRRARRAAAVVMLGLALLISLHPVWLPLVAHILIMNEPPQLADAIVVLGGGSGDREVTGARLYAEGYAPLVMTTGSVIGLPGLPNVTFAELGAAELIRRGVPESAIIQLAKSDSTCDDVRETMAALPAGAKRIIVVTDPFHTRRAQWLFQQQVPKLEVVIVAADPSWFNSNGWWRESRSIIVVGQEYVKFAMTLLEGCD